MNEPVWKFCFSVKSKLTNMLCFLSEGPAFSIILHDMAIVWEDILLLGRGSTPTIKSLFWGSLIHLELGTSFRKYLVDNSILWHVGIVWGRLPWQGLAGNTQAGEIPILGGHRDSKCKVSLHRIDISFQISNQQLSLKIDYRTKRS